MPDKATRNSPTCHSGRAPLWARGGIRLEIAAEHASTRVPVVGPEQRVAEIGAARFGGDFECASHVAVCREGIFLGLIPIEDVLGARHDASAEELMDGPSPRVAPGVDQEIAPRSRTASPRSRWSMPRGAFEG